MAKKKEAAKQPDTKRLLAPASQSLGQYLHARMQLDKEMDERLVDEAAADMMARLDTNRLHGKGQWWDPERCVAEQLVASAKESLTKGEWLDAAILCLMVHVRVKATS